MSNGLEDLANHPTVIKVPTSCATVHVWVCFKAGFFFGAGKITQAQNNSRSKITQGFFKITQENFVKKLMVPEVFGLIRTQKLERRGQYLFFFFT